MTIATKTGDRGTTALTGGMRVSKADLRVEAYGTVDELNACLGMARSLCHEQDLRDRTEKIQRTLFRVGATLSRPVSGAEQPAQPTLAEDVEDLGAQVLELEAGEGILSDWTLPGAHPESAAFEVARTVCRRAERCAVRLQENGEQVPETTLAYLNRLSDLLWLFGRVIEVRAGVNARLRDEKTQGPAWSRAW